VDSEQCRAIVVVDMVDELMSSPEYGVVAGLNDVVSLIEGELMYFRERHRPVFFTCPVIKDEKGAIIRAQMHHALWPRPGETVIDKTAPSAFFETSLEESLKHVHVRSLTLVGIATNTGVLFTAADAMARGFEVAVPETCAFASTRVDHFFALRQIRDVLPTWNEFLRGKRQ